MADEGSTARASTMFGNYDIIETVGQGGMGVVYRATDTSLGRTVALKVLKDDLRTHDQVVARFQREAEAFASLDHTNIVHIYTVGAVGRIPYIAMEFINGEPLSLTMKREKRIEWKRALRLAEQIALGLQCAHEAQIIHRDIKPANILIDKKDHAYVTDFGIAKVLTAETQLTVDGSRLGTPQYMSPERCQNKEITASSDLYSLGVMVFQMVTGRLPYEAKSPVDLIRKIVSDPPGRISDFREGLPEDLERLIAYAIEKHPKDRPPSSGDWAMLCARVREGKPLVSDDPNLAGSLENLRETISTPFSSHSDSGWTTRDTLSNPISKVRAWWNDQSDWMRTGLVGVLVALMTGAAGVFVAREFNRGYALEAVAGIETGVGPWQRESAVGLFLDEAPGVVLASLQLPSFVPTQALWTPDGAVLLAMEGVGSRAGQQALCRVSPHEHSALVLLPPFAGAFRLETMQTRPERALGLDRGFLYTRPIQLGGGAEEDGIFTARAEPGLSGAREILTAADLNMLAGVSPTSLDALALSPDGSRIVLAYTTGQRPTRYGLGELTLANNRRPTAFTPVAESDTEIDQILFLDARSSFIFTRGSGNNAREVWYRDANSEDVRARRLFEDDTSIRGIAAGPGARIVLVRRNGSGESTLHLTGLAEKPESHELGAGTSAVFHPTGDHVFSTAEDRRGHLQVWAIQAAAPFERVQLTHLQTGIDRNIAVSSDGSQAFAFARDTELPSLVLIDVSPAKLAALGL